VADDEVVVHFPATPTGPAQVLRRVGLAPQQVVEIAGLRARILPRPPGELLCTVCTINDTHIGETVCGAVGPPDSPNHIPGIGVAPGEAPYPATMSAAAAAEIAALDPAAVVAKGDLTAAGLPTQLAIFEACLRPVPGDRLHTCLGNHDVVDPDHPLLGPPTQLVSVPGLTLAILDTSAPGRAGGMLSRAQLDWLDEVARNATQPVLVLGHHPPWDPGSPGRPDDYFGIAPADSERLVEVVTRRPAIVAYAAGHTHRNLVRHFGATGSLPWIEVACVKDFPGSWAEYRVFEGGLLQVHRRISAPAALAWSERCRGLIQGCYPAYAFGSLADRCFAIWPRH
jgi:Icc protein